MESKNIVIVAAKRTAVGSHGGTLKFFTPTDLGVFAAQSAIQSIDIDPKLIDHVIFGNVIHTGGDTPYMPRHIGLRVGVPQRTPALLVSRMCNSGYEAIISGAQQILLGESKVVLVGGSESMSNAPFTLHNHRWGNKLGNSSLRDILLDTLKDNYIDTPMAITAETLAVKYSISREECDQFAFESQQHAKKALENNYFSQEVAPIEITHRNKNTMFTIDEHPRDTTLEALNTLKPVFKKDGVVTAGNASGIGDGAAALILMSEDTAQELGLKPLARIVSWGITGCSPEIMGIGVVDAVKKALKRANLSLSQINRMEINEAFAAQYLAVEKELSLDRSIVNVNGGAIALAHPVGCTGAKLIVSLVHELERNDLTYGLSSACAGGGQGTAIIIESNK